MNIRNNLLAYLNLGEHILQLEGHYNKLLARPVRLDQKNITLDNLQAIIDHNSELSTLKAEIEAMYEQQERLRNELIFHLTSMGLKPGVKVPFLLNDEETTASFYFSEHLKLCFEY